MSRADKRKNERRGRRAETIAALWLILKGYKIRERRFRSPFGEIDIIASKKQTIIAVEVKARQTEAIAKTSIGIKQMDRIKNSLLAWCKSHSQLSCSLRFDVITIVPRRLPLHIRDAWRPDY